MNTLTIKLKQHTPLIHFQHDQDGATLRASEVKPKLDKYILKQLGWGDYGKGKEEAKTKGWLVGKGDHPALDYKMRIETEGKRFEHKIKIINANMIAVFYKGIIIRFLSINSDLIQEIKKNVSDFFIVYNFGFRQSKGYGSFTVDNEKEIGTEMYRQILEKQGGYDTTLLSTIPLETRIRYSLKQVRIPKNIRDKNIKNELNKFKSIIIRSSQPFDALSCLENFSEAIKIEINKKIKEVQRNQDSDIRQYKNDIEVGLKRSLGEIDKVHNDFLYNYFERILEKAIGSKYQCYKSGRNKPYEKSHLRNFLGICQGDQEKIVFWDKRFMKQKIDCLKDSNEDLKRLGLRLKDDHRKDANGVSELYSKDSANQSYFFVRALLGLEGNFEFQTNNEDRRFVVSVDGEDVERFQSIIMFKVINNRIFTCIKPKGELNKILNKGFAFKLNVKDKKGNTYLKKPISMGSINTPALPDKDIDTLYCNIKSFFTNVTL
jgi:hypothetical protein